MTASKNATHYFIVKKAAAAQSTPDIILSDQGTAYVTEDDLDFSGRSFRILASPFQKACFASAHAEPEQAPDIIRALRKAYPGLTQLVFPKARGGRRSGGDAGRLPEEDRQVFWGFLKAMAIPLERFLLDPACLVIIDGPDDLLGDMIKNGLFDIENVETLENLRDPELMEKYVPADPDGR